MKQNTAMNRYLTHAANLKTEHPEWRWGQTLFNALAMDHPAIAEEIRGSPLDPFHKEGDALNPFMDWAIERLSAIEEGGEK